MQLNFMGLILIGLGIVLLGLGISGNYGRFGASLKAAAKKPASGSSPAQQAKPVPPHTPF